jgi:hypothetical protein
LSEPCRLVFTLTSESALSSSFKKTSVAFGIFFGKDGKPAFRDILRNSPFGRIAFANTDLSGDPSHVTAIEEGERAAGQLLDGALRG